MRILLYSFFILYGNYAQVPVNLDLYPADKVLLGSNFDSQPILPPGYDSSGGFNSANLNKGGSPSANPSASQAYVIPRSDNKEETINWMSRGSSGDISKRIGPGVAPEHGGNVIRGAYTE